MLSLLIKVYKKTYFVKKQFLLSIFGFTTECKHRPTCSENLLIQVEKHGTIAGLLKATWRLLTCF